MITCPNCGYDHEIKEYHIILKKFTMKCSDELCGADFNVDLEIVAHTNIITPPDTGQSKQQCGKPQEGET
jgi:hypothetical protein